MYNQIILHTNVMFIGLLNRFSVWEKMEIRTKNPFLRYFWNRKCGFSLRCCVITSLFWNLWRYTTFFSFKEHSKKSTFIVTDIDLWIDSALMQMQEKTYLFLLQFVCKNKLVVCQEKQKWYIRHLNFQKFALKSSFLIFY